MTSNAYSYQEDNNNDDDDDDDNYLHHDGRPTRMETLGHVTSLAVLHDYRRQGLAQALMKQLHFHLEHYHHVPVTACGLHVRKSNTAACRLYQKDGYEIAQVIPSYYQDGEDAYFMKKTLQSSLAASTAYQRYGGKCWKHGPSNLQLPRQHLFLPSSSLTALVMAFVVGLDGDDDGRNKC